MPGLTKDEIAKRDEACHQWTGFKSWEVLHHAWRLCCPYWGLVNSSPKNYHKILAAFIAKDIPVAKHARTRSYLDEFILSWAYEHTSINLSLLATMVKMSSHELQNILTSSLLVIAIIFEAYFVNMPSIRELHKMTPEVIQRAFQRTPDDLIVAIDFDCTEIETESSDDLLLSSVKFSSKDQRPTVKLGLGTSVSVGTQHRRFILWCEAIYGGGATEAIVLDAFANSTAGKTLLSDPDFGKAIIVLYKDRGFRDAKSLFWAHRADCYYLPPTQPQFTAAQCAYHSYQNEARHGVECSNLAIKSPHPVGFTLHSAELIPTQVRLSALAKMRVAKANHDTLVAQNMEAKYMDWILPTVTQSRTIAVAQHLLALIEGAPLELRNLIPAIPTITPSALHEVHYKKLCERCQTIPWEQYLHEHRNKLLQQSQQDIVRNDRQAGEKRHAPPVNTSQDTRIFHPERAVVSSSIVNHRTTRLLESRYITHIEFSHSEQDNTYHLVARVHASMCISVNYVVLIIIHADASVYIRCTCVSGDSGYCSHGVTVLLALSCTPPLPVYWSPKAMPLTKAIVAAKKTPIMTVAIWRHENSKNIPLWISPNPCASIAVIEQQITDTLLPVYTYACPFHNCRKTFKKKMPYSKHIRHAHAQYWITMPQPLRDCLLQLQPWDDAVNTGANYGLLTYEQWAEAFPRTAKACDERNRELGDAPRPHHK